MEQQYCKIYGCGPIFFRKKHICPICKMVMKKTEHRQIINSKSAEANEYGNFAVDDMRLYGDVLVITYSFDCPACQMSYEPQKLKKAEKRYRTDLYRQKWHKFIHIFRKMK